MPKPEGFYTKDEKVRPIMGRKHPHVRPLRKGTSSLRIPKRTISKKHVKHHSTTYKGWHSSKTGRLGISDPEKSTEGVGYYVAFEKDTAESFGRKTFPISVTLHNPLDARGEPAYLLHEMDEVLQSPKKGDSEWLSAIKEAVKRSKTTDANWGKNQARLNQKLTDVLQERGYDGILIENWMVKFATKKKRAELKGFDAKS